MNEINVVVFGASRCGKTQLVSRFVNNSFNEAYEPTIEDLYSKEVKQDGRITSMKILDTQGIEQFRAMRDIYIKNGSAFLLVYDTSDVSSLTELESIGYHILDVKSSLVPMAVVGTKIDRLPSRESSAEAIRRGTKLASNIGKPHIATSAKSGRHVDSAFESIMLQNARFEPHRRKNSEAGDSISSSVSIEGWLNDSQEKGIAPRPKPSFKNSMIRIKRSVARLGESHSIQNVRQAMSSTSSSSSSSSSPRQRNNYTAERRPEVQNYCRPCDPRAKNAIAASIAAAQESNTGAPVDPGFKTITQNKLSENPKIVYVNEKRKGHKSGVCVIM